MPHKLLVVDDDPMLLDLMQTFLTDKGFFVRIAGDGQAAINALHEDLNFAAVVSDVFMPNIDGFQLLEQVSTKFPDIPVLMMSGGLSDREAKQKLGKAARFMEKPIDWNALPVLLNEIIA